MIDPKNHFDPLTGPQTYTSHFNSAKSEIITPSQSRDFFGRRIITYLRQLKNRKLRLNQQFYMGDYYDRELQ